MLNNKTKPEKYLTVLLVIISVAESLILKQMVISILSTIFFTTKIISKNTGRWTASSEAVLLFVSVFLVLLVVLPYFGIQQNQASITTILYFLLAMAAIGTLLIKEKIENRANIKTVVVASIGSIFLLILLARSIQLNGSFYPWAMSGDSRNHLLIVRQTVSDGRVKVIGSYPAFGDAMVGVISGWRIDENFAKLGRLSYEIRQLAITNVLYLMGIGFLSSRSVSRSMKKNSAFALIAAGAVSFVTLSQLWLENYLRWGFMSSGMVILICIALFNVLSSREIPLGLSIIYVLIATLAVLATFPIMVGAVVGLSLGPLISERREGISVFRNKLVFLFLLVFPFGLVGIFTSHLPFQGYIQGKLDLSGAITSISPKFTIVFVVLFALMVFACGQTTVNLAVSGLTLSLSTLVIDKYLDHVLSSSYYLQKFRWLSVFLICIILCTCLVSIYLEVSNVPLRLVVAGLSGFAPLLFISPIMLKSPVKNYVKSMIQSWEYPTLQEARKIIDVNARTPRAVFWQVSPNYVSTQLMNMWLMLGIEEVKSKPDIVLWTYQRDQFSLQTICEFAVDNKPITIWVQAPEVKKVVKPYCNSDTVFVRPIRPLASR